MRSGTAIIIVGAILVVIAVAVLIRVEDPSQPRVDPQQQRGAEQRSARVEERLAKLRADYKRESEHSKSDRGVESVQRRVLSKPSVPEAEAPRIEAPPRRGARDAAVDEEEEFDESIEGLRNTLLSHPDPDERLDAVFNLSTSSETAEAAQVLVEGLADTDAEVRLAVVEALGDFTDQIAPDVLMPALDDPDPEVRFEAVGILGDIETPEALALVRRALNDSNDDVRSLAEGILEIEGMR